MSHVEEKQEDLVMEGGGAGMSAEAASGCNVSGLSYNNVCIYEGKRLHLISCTRREAGL